MRINEILYVIKMLSREQGWCHRVEFFYDHESPQHAMIAFYIGPIKYRAAITSALSGKMFLLPSESFEKLPQSNSFVIFIGDDGQCVMLTKKSIIAYMSSHPKPAGDKIFIELDYIYRKRFWASGIPDEDDLKILYPEKFKKIE